MTDRPSATEAPKRATPRAADARDAATPGRPQWPIPPAGGTDPGGTARRAAPPGMPGDPEAPPPVIPLERRSDRWISLMLSLLFHGALLALIGFGFWRWHRPTPPVAQLAIDATVVDSRSLARAAQAERPAAQPATPPPAQTVVPPPTVSETEPPEQTGPPAPPKPSPEQVQRAEAERKAREAAEKQAQAQAQRQAEEARQQEQQRQQAKREQARREEAKREQAKREEAKRQAEAEARHRAEAKRLEQQRAAEAKRLAAQKAAEAKRRAEAAALAESQADLQRGIDEEQRAMAARGALATWKQQIEARLRQNWIKPPTAREGIDCVLTVTQVPGGQVVNATIGTCNGDTAVRQSIIDAAYRASPLPPPPDPSLFQRVLIIHFTPTD